MTRNSNGRLEVKSRLIAFEHVSGSHDGESLSKVLMKILEDYGILHKVSLLVNTRRRSGDANVLGCLARLLHA